MNGVYIGIDTSNYKTSVAAVDEDGSVLFERSELLEVPHGKRGLRQSECFYHHSMRLPGYIGELLRSVMPREYGETDHAVAAVGVSDRPRRQEGSYMPCFSAGVNAARILGSSLRVPVYRFSHQEGHAAAIMEGSGSVSSERSVFMHLSGGTTEALLCEPDEKGYHMEIAGGTLDISFGQLLDRFGVALGLPFPSGRYLDETAAEYLSESSEGSSAASVLPRTKLKDGYFNLSGAETRLMRFAERYKTCADPLSDPDVKAVTAETFRAISDILIKEAVFLSDRYGIKDVFIAGGVASSRTVRSLLNSSETDISIHFGAPELSGDNAAGTALLCRRAACR